MHLQQNCLHIRLIDNNSYAMFACHLKSKGIGSQYMHVAQHQQNLVDHVQGTCMRDVLTVMGLTLRALAADNYEQITKHGQVGLSHQILSPPPPPLKYVRHVGVGFSIDNTVRV